MYDFLLASKDIGFTHVMLVPIYVWFGTDLIIPFQLFFLVCPLSSYCSHLIISVINLPLKIS